MRYSRRTWLQDHKGPRVGTVKAAPALREGQVRCACGAATTLTRMGRVRKHKTPAGDECPMQLHAGHDLDVDVSSVPIVVPPERGGNGRTAVEREREPSRLDAGSNCRECGKWLPGERILCGACYVKGDKR